MANEPLSIEEKKKKLQELQAQLVKRPTLKGALEPAIQNLQREIDEEEAAASQSAASTTPSSIKQSKIPTQSGVMNKGSVQAILQGVQNALSAVQPASVAPPIDEDALLAKIQGRINSMAGSMSFDQLKPFIEQYLQTKREIELSIPQYGIKVNIESEMAKIPNFFKVMDDVLVGNNVYLIGEAGTGKTFLAAKIAKALNLQMYMINCSQYTTPIDIMGGQTISGFKEGQLLKAWENGGILVLDEMPKLDANTAGLFNDALSKSSKTIDPSEATIPNPRKGGEPTIPRNPKFGCIATGNIYPNKVDLSRYVGNNQQDLSLLDRFSGGVYFVGYDDKTSERVSTYKFIYDLLVGKPSGANIGLRYFLLEKNYTSYAVVSLRTVIAVRVSFEIELVRAMKSASGQKVIEGGKTFADSIESYLVAFNSNPVVKNDIIQKFNLTRDNLNAMAKSAIQMIMNKEWSEVLTKEFYDGGDVAIKEIEEMMMISEAIIPETKIS